MIESLKRTKHVVNLLAIAIGIAFGANTFAQRHPDVLFIAVDDMNDWTGHLAGHPQASTPNIDRLVDRGVVFTQAHCAAPACNPSRAALMSGLRPWTTGIYTNGNPAARVLKDSLTINRHFMANGYRVNGGGKIYHNLAAEGRKDSWSEWVGLFKTDGGDVHNLNGLKMSHFDWGPLKNKTEDMSDHKLTSWAIEQLRSQPTDQPLFLAVGYTKPHLPWHVPQEYFDRFPLDKIQLPVTTASDLDDIPKAGLKMAKPDGDHAAVIRSGQWEKAVQGYLASISFVDDQVGRLLAGLESSPRAKNTIVVWWTDHGWHLGEKQHWRKFALWEDATRTSFAIAAPGVTKPAQRCDAPVDYTMIYSTICELTGLPTPSHVSGPSLVPLLRNPKAAWPHVAICTHGTGNHAVVDDRYRYIRYQDGSQELYDHQQDPREWYNLAERADQSANITRLAKHLPTREAPPTSKDEQ